MYTEGYTIGRRSFQVKSEGMYMAWGGSRRGAGRPRNLLNVLVEPFDSVMKSFFR